MDTPLLAAVFATGMTTTDADGQNKFTADAIAQGAAADWKSKASTAMDDPLLTAGLSEPDVRHTSAKGR